MDKRIMENAVDVVERTVPSLEDNYQKLRAARRLQRQASDWFNDGNIDINNSVEGRTLFQMVCDLGDLINALNKWTTEANERLKDDGA